MGDDDDDEDDDDDDDELVTIDITFVKMYMSLFLRFFVLYILC